MEERNRSDEIRETRPAVREVKTGRAAKASPAESSQEPDDGAIAPFIPELSDALMDPARRHSQGAQDEKDKRLWVTMKSYSVLWELYQRKADVLATLAEGDVEPIVQGVARAYDRLYWPKGEGGGDWFY